MHHAGELTFAYVAPAPTREGGVLASFERVHRALLEELGVPGLHFAREVARVRSDRPGSPWCFHRSTPLCLVLDGRKVLGSAQRRSRGWVLHHGSLIVDRHPWVEGLGALADAEDPLVRAIVEERVTRALARALGGEPRSDALGAEELALAHELAPRHSA